LTAGTVTFLLTDIEDSTRLWEAEPEAMEEALQRHDRLLTGVIAGRGGDVVISRGEWDSFFAVFPSAVSALEAAGDLPASTRAGSLAHRWCAPYTDGAAQPGEHGCMKRLRTRR
jgi:class 3 adenylate cyclase